MKKITFLLVLTLLTGSLSAQEIEGVSTNPGRSTTFVNNGFWDNWFIGAGASANVYFGDNDAQASFFDRVTFAPNIQIGKWISPYFGIRVKASSLSNLHTFNNDASMMSRHKFVTTELNFMWNVTDYLMNYSSSRVYSFIPYVGAGWAFGYDYQNFPEGTYLPNHVHSATVDVGMIHRFRFTERMAFDIDMSGKLVRDRFDLRTGSNRTYDILGGVSANLVFNVGKNATFSEAVLRDQSEIDALNARINAQRAEITALQQRPAPEPTVVVQEVVKEVDRSLEPVNNVVLFPLNGTKVQSHQEVNVYNVAKYLRENPETKVRVIGYTDKATGTPAINERLSRERAQAVANLIINKYGISGDRVSTEWEGMMNPPFDVVEWNRAVIMYIE